MSKKNKQPDRNDYWFRWLQNNPDIAKQLDFERPGWKRFAKKLAAIQHAEMMKEYDRLAAERFAMIAKKIEELSKQKAAEAIVKDAEVVKEEPK